jgi:hypothetical protein
MSVPTYTTTIIGYDVVSCEDGSIYAPMVPTRQGAVDIAADAPHLCVIPLLTGLPRVSYVVRQRPA